MSVHMFVLLVSYHVTFTVMIHVFMVFWFYYSSVHQLIHYVISLL